MNDQQKLPQSKLSQLRAFAASGDWTSALRIASRFQDLGDHREQITKAWSATSYPEFYRDLGIDPDAATADGIAALKERYSL